MDMHSSRNSMHDARLWTCRVPGTACTMRVCGHAEFQEQHARCVFVDMQSSRNSMHDACLWTKMVQFGPLSCE